MLPLLLLLLLTFEGKTNSIALSLMYSHVAGCCGDDGGGC